MCALVCACVRVWHRVELNKKTLEEKNTEFNNHPKCYRKLNLYYIYMYCICIVSNYTSECVHIVYTSYGTAKESVREKSMVKIDYRFYRV